MFDHAFFHGEELLGEIDTIQIAHLKRFILESRCLPVHVARVQVASAIDIVVQIRRYQDGTRKIHSISECLGLDEHNHYRFQDIFRFQASGRDPDGKIQGQLLWTGQTPTFQNEPLEMGYLDRVDLTKELFSVEKSVVKQSQDSF